MHATVLFFFVPCDLYFGSHSHSLYCYDIPSIQAYYILYMKEVYLRHQNNDPISK